eukprot:CAMPEP_0174938404 /NCGR_PEP_ID=MMETSP1355-20121228/63388_1 /TAXON_ID=464990 /ORGANISM="Hemiselmis tepida, Strain CCMP443" /LENGTH=94 /DNA_ID=CAMNT_0016185329 /DNA_START=41 /DNA_END=322 /DNA_ORIENTATION=+
MGRPPLTHAPRWHHERAKSLLQAVLLLLLGTALPPRTAGGAGGGMSVAMAAMHPRHPLLCGVLRLRGGKARDDGAEEGGVLCQHSSPVPDEAPD